MGATEKLTNAKKTNWITEGLSDTEVENIVKSAKAQNIYRKLNSNKLLKTSKKEEN